MRARDVMEPVIEVLQENETLRTAVNRMRTAPRRPGCAGVKGMIVVDRNGRPCGMLSVKDILRAVMPVYLTQADLGEFTWDGMLESMTLKLADKPVSELMHRNLISVPEEAPLMECADLMIKRGIQRLPVLDRDGLVKGMVYIRDLYNAITKVLHDDQEAGHGA